MWLGFFLVTCSSIPRIRRSRSACVLEEIPHTDVSHLDQSGNYNRMENPSNTTTKKIEGKKLTGITQVDKKKQQLEKSGAKADDTLHFEVSAIW